MAGVGENRGIGTGGTMGQGRGVVPPGEAVGEEVFRRQRDYGGGGGGVDRQGDLQAFRDGGATESTRGGAASRVPDKAGSQERTRQVSSHSEHERRQPAPATIEFQDGGALDRFAAGPARRLFDQVGPEGGLFSRRPGRESVKSVRHQLEGSGVPVHSAPFWLLPVANHVHEDSPGDGKVLPREGDQDRRLFGRLFGDVPVVGGGHQGAGRGYSANAGQFGFFGEGGEIHLGAHQTARDAGADSGHGIATGGDPGGQATESRGARKNFAGQGQGVGTDFGQDRGDSGLGVKGVSLRQDVHQGIVQLDRRGAQGQLGVGPADNTVASGQGGRSVAAGQPQAQAGHGHLEALEKLQGVFGRVLEGLGRSPGGPQSRRPLDEGPAAAAHQYPGGPGRGEGARVFRGAITGQEGDADHRLHDGQSILGERGRPRRAEESSGQEDLGARGRVGLSSFGGVAGGSAELGGGPGEQGGSARRLVGEEGGISGARRQVGASLHRPAGGRSQQPSSAFQFPTILPRDCGGGRLFPGLVRAQQLGGALLRAGGSRVAASGRIGSKGNGGPAGMGGAALVAPSALFGQGVAPSFTSEFPSRPVRVRGARQEPSVEIFRSEDLITAARAKSTWTRYSQIWGQFSLFCVKFRKSALPASPSTVLDYLVHLVNAGRGGSAGAVLAAVKSEHLDSGFTDPTQQRNVRLAAEGASRIAAEKRGWPKERAPFPVAALLDHIASPSFSSVSGFRDAALVSVGLRLMLRPGELIKLRLEDVKLEQDGAKIRLGRTKADQKAERRPLLVEPSESPACPVKLLTSLVQKRKAQGAAAADPLFVGAAGKRLTSSAVTSIVRRMAEAHGLDPGSVSGHSLRIGGASAAADGGLSMTQIMAAGGWKSGAVQRYLSPVKKKENAKSVSKVMGL